MEIVWSWHYVFYPVVALVLYFLGCHQMQAKMDSNNVQKERTKEKDRIEAIAWAGLELKEAFDMALGSMLVSKELKTIHLVSFATQFLRAQEVRKNASTSPSDLAKIKEVTNQLRTLSFIVRNEGVWDSLAAANIFTSTTLTKENLLSYRTKTDAMSAIEQSMLDSLSGEVALSKNHEDLILLWFSKRDVISCW